MPISVTALFSRRSVSNASEATIQLLKLFQIPVTRTTVIDTIEGHPNYPSLVSISDSLKRWKVNNMALQVDKSKVDELPVPFIAYVKGVKGTFEVITAVNAQQVKYQLNGKEKWMEKEQFTKDWTGVVLLAEPGTQPGEKNYKQRNRLQLLNDLRLPFILFGALLIYFLFIISGIIGATQLHFLSSLQLLTKFIGITVCGLLLWYELDKSNPALQKICKGRKASCETILNSKHAKLFNWIGWSEIGFFYFTGGFIFLYFSQGNLYNGFFILCLLNLLALPYLFFSIWYQGIILKKWCRLCLLIQALLFIEFLISLAGTGLYERFPTIDVIQVSRLLLSFAIPALFWAFTKTYVQKSQQFDTYKKMLSRIKHDPEIFNALLPKQRNIEIPASHLGMILGHPNAPVTIVKVSNPYCPACGLAHTMIRELLEDHPHVKVQLIFTTREDDNLKAIMVKHIMALYEKGQYNMEDVLDFWYKLERKDYKTLADKFPVNEALLNNGEKLKAMNVWCDANLITFTPAFFLKGFQLPDIYSAEDIGYFVAPESL